MLLAGRVYPGALEGERREGDCKWSTHSAMLSERTRSLGSQTTTEVTNTNTNGSHALLLCCVATAAAAAGHAALHS